MSKQETIPGGLLGKVARLVRSPAGSWTEPDSLQDDRESQYSKQMLKEMIERKRRNDFVRRREFDQLRKIRQREAIHGRRPDDPGNTRPSFFQSSMASPDERAVTLKKIDEIEAQMSQQWWKGKQGSSEPTVPGDFGVTEPTNADRAFAPTAPLSIDSLPGAVPQVPPLFADDSMSISSFGSKDASLHGAPVPAPAPALSDMDLSAPVAPVAAPVPEPEVFVHEPDLEEAAIRFANGDMAGAESGLLEVLAQHKDDNPQDQFEIWMTLFDLYRATGQQDRFDSLAIDFAALYGRSSPLWFSIPEQLGIAIAPQAEVQAVPKREFSWNAPAQLAVSSVAALQASVERSVAPWTLSWSRLTNIEPPAVPLLADLFSKWADRKGDFVFVGVQQFNTVLEVMTQSGDRGSGPEWWRLRMAALRLMNRPDEFELVALDYCVTYEVSPPSWAVPVCGYTDDGEAPESSHADTDAPMSDFGVLSVPASLDAGPAIELSGQIDGDAAPLLDPLLQHLHPGIPLSIACDRLLRVDFAAAGSVLNWAADQQAQGHVIHFYNLHRLAAVFFNVIGINEHAWVIPRKN